MTSEYLKAFVATDVFNPEKAWFQLDEEGMIRDCDHSACEIFGCDSTDLLGRHISRLLPQLGSKALVCGTHLDPQLAHECHIGRRFDAADAVGRQMPVELFLNLLCVGGSLRVSLFVQPCVPASAANSHRVNDRPPRLRLVA